MITEKLKFKMQKNRLTSVPTIEIANKVNTQKRQLKAIKKHYLWQWLARVPLTALTVHGVNLTIPLPALLYVDAIDSQEFLYPRIDNRIKKVAYV